MQLLYGYEFRVHEEKWICVDSCFFVAEEYFGIFLDNRRYEVNNQVQIAFLHTIVEVELLDEIKTGRFYEVQLVC